MFRTKVIVVEDDGDLREQVVDFLALSGFVAVGVGSAAEFYRYMVVEKFPIVVLDLNLPDEDGLALAAHLRRQSDMGIIMVTARGAIEDRVRGFETGADIYMTKPVDLRELVAAVNSLARRLGMEPTNEPRRVNEAPSAVSHWRFEPAAFTLTAPNGRAVHVTAMEVALLARLTTLKGGVASRGELLDAIGYDPADPGNRNLDAALRRLRLKVEEQTGTTLPLRTVHGVGYQLQGDIRVA